MTATAHLIVSAEHAIILTRVKRLAELPITVEGRLLTWQTNETGRLLYALSHLDETFDADRVRSLCKIIDRKSNA